MQNGRLLFDCNAFGDWRIVGPECIDEALSRHDTSAVEYEIAEHRSLPLSCQCQPNSIDLNSDLSQNPPAHLHRPRVVDVGELRNKRQTATALSALSLSFNKSCTVLVDRQDRRRIGCALEHRLRDETETLDPWQLVVLAELVDGVA